MKPEKTLLMVGGHGHVVVLFLIFFLKTTSSLYLDISLLYTFVLVCYCIYLKMFVGVCIQRMEIRDKLCGVSLPINLDKCLFL